MKRINVFKKKISLSTLILGIIAIILVIGVAVYALPQIGADIAVGYKTQKCDRVGVTVRYKVASATSEMKTKYPKGAVAPLTVVLPKGPTHQIVLDLVNLTAESGSSGKRISNFKTGDRIEVGGHIAVDKKYPGTVHYLNLEFVSREYEQTLTTLKYSIDGSTLEKVGDYELNLKKQAFTIPAAADRGVKVNTEFNFEPRVWSGTDTDATCDFAELFNLDMSRGASQTPTATATASTASSATSTATQSASATATATATASAMSTKSSTASPSPSASVSVAASSTSTGFPIIPITFTIQNGWNVVTIPQNIQVIKAEAFTSKGLSVFEYNKYGGQKWYASVPNGDNNRKYIHRKTGYYVWNPNSQIKVTAQKVTQNVASIAILHRGWNLLANSKDEAQKLGDIWYRTVLPGYGGNCADPNSSACKLYKSCASKNYEECSRFNTLKELLTGDANAKRGYAKLYLIVDTNTGDAKKAFRVIEVTSANIDTVEIPAKTGFWFYLFK